jgi:hypothetical protein
MEKQNLAMQQLKIRAAELEEMEQNRKKKDKEVSNFSYGSAFQNFLLKITCNHTIEIEQITLLYTF